ncbi:MAG TPA: hypothetical protein VKE74_36480 [Gemmataceae bacterium]|nr:hypothetical protein [Gemmataceae bacterium]
MDHPNVVLVRKMWACLAKLVGFGDGGGPVPGFENPARMLREEVLTPDVKYFMPGHHPLSGVKEGVEEVIAFFRQLALKVGLIQDAQQIYPFGQSGAVEIHRFYGARPEVKLAGTNCFTYKLRSGRIAEIRVHNNIQPEIDNHFCSVWQYKPLPDRLMED